MGHENATYILIQTADFRINGGTFELEPPYNQSTSYDQERKFLIYDDITAKNADDIRYHPGAPYPAWVLALFPNAPNGTLAEALALKRTYGPAGANWSEAR